MSAGSAANRNQAFARALVAELANAGIRHVCVCPGSRSTPLIAALCDEARLELWSHVDERCASFFALGLARASGTPVALVSTSGTAAANFLPAIVEAWHARVPLVVLTADRPPELRGWGAAQTIDQNRLYGSHVRWFVECPLPEASSPLLRFARALGSRLVATACGPPPGPVHANLPFREPLEPTPVPGDVPSDLDRTDPLAAQGRGRGVAYTRASRPTGLVDDDPIERLARSVRDHPRGVLVCGPLALPHRDAARLAEACVRVARAAGWPILADGLSPLRTGPHVPEAPLIETYDALLRADRFADAHAPDLVLRVGAPPTGKALQRWLERHPDAAPIVIDPDATWADPSHLAAELVQADPVTLLAALAERVEKTPSPSETRWLESFERADLRAREAIASGIEAEAALLEPAVVRAIAAALPEGSTWFVSNSMPVRDVDGFLPVDAKALRVWGQRGANGIDGIVSTALGLRAAQDGPALGLIGDLALLHDLGGLLAARRHGIAMPLVVIHNDGGGIFSFLPARRFGDSLRFEELFLTPHGLDLSRVASLFDLDHERVASTRALGQAVRRALTARSTTLIEVPVEREASVAHHHRIWDAVAQAVT